MKINMSFSHMKETVATETIEDIHSADTIMQKGILEIGKTALDAEELLKPRCMSITEQTNTILKNLKIRPPMYPPDAPNVIL